MNRFCMGIALSSLESHASLVDANQIECTVLLKSFPDLANDTLDTRLLSWTGS
jgi:hypothetical protein